MSTSLRERQKQLAREAILNSLVQEIANVGSLDFSVGDVAKRAGVSLRTVYNYFDSRQALVDAFTIWVDDEIHESGGVIAPESVDDLPAALVANFMIFEERSDLAEVLAHMDPADHRTPAHERRSKAFADAVAGAYSHLNEREQMMVTGLIRQLASVRNWYQLTRVHGLNSEEAANASAWALEQLTVALDRGESPSPPIAAL